MVRPGRRKTPLGEAPKPSAGELAILQVIWQRGEATVRDVNDALNLKQAQGYTTTLKQMQIMREKGLLERREAEGVHLYRPAEAQEKTQQRILGELIDRAFGGSWTELVMQAVSSRRASREELGEIRKMIEAYERKQAGKERA